MNKFDIDKGNIIICSPIPIYEPSFQKISTQMRKNCDILKKEFSDHVDKEIKRFNKEKK